MNGALLISGSRHFRPGVLDKSHFAALALRLAADRGWHVVIGDASGVDSMVIRRAAEFHVPLVICGTRRYGLRLTPPQDAQVILTEGGTAKSCFLVRDAFMVDMVAKLPMRGFLGLWNGYSRGTKFTATKAKAAGIPGMLYQQLDSGGMVVVERWERYPSVRQNS